MAISLPESLLADTAWLRGLSRRLTGDAESAADLEQDVAVAALTQPVAAASSRSWLATVARNLAVSMRRRRSAEDRRMRALSPHEPTPSPAELVASAELQQRAVAAVLALPPVYRDTVLLRFMRGLSIAAVARAMGVPEETVRTRQRRALQTLRAQLAPDERGRGVPALLVPFASWGALVKAKHVVVAAGILLLALVGSVPLWSSGWNEPAKAQDAPMLVAAPNPRAEAPTAAPETRPAETADARQPVAAAVADPEVSTAGLLVQVLWAESGEPAAGVAVRCRTSDRPGTMVVSDARGQVRFEALAPDKYRVTLPDYSNDVITLDAGAQETLRFELEEWIEVNGVVLDEGDVPAAGAELFVSHVGVAPQWLFPAGRTDRNGRFRIRTGLGGTLLGAHGRHGATSNALMLTSDRFGGATPEEVTLRLSSDVCPVRGRVTDPEGNPIAGAWVQLGSFAGNLLPDDQGRLWHRPLASVRETDADGRFEIAAARVEAAHLTVSRRGFAPHRETLELLPHVTRELELVLSPGAVLAGRVRDEDGSAVEGAEVSVAGLPYPQRDDCETDSDGEFELADLPAGELRCKVTAQGLSPIERTFTFAPAANQTWDAVLHRGHRILGRLVDARDQPLARWWIAVPGASKRAKTGDDGTFVVAGCAADGNTLVVRHHFGFVPETMRFENVAPSEDERVFVVPDDCKPSAHIRGQCVGPDGLPLAEVRINLWQGGQPVLVDNRVAEAGVDGSFDLGPLPPGKYGFRPAHTQCDFDATEVELHAEEFHDAGTLRGR